MIESCQSVKQKMKGSGQKCPEPFDLFTENILPEDQFATRATASNRARKSSSVSV